MAIGKGKKSQGALQTTITPASVASNLSAFSPLSTNDNPSYYAHLHRAPDAHTLRVYEFTTGKCVSRHALGEQEGEKVTSLEWTFAPAPVAANGGAAEEEAANGKRGKKRRKSDAGAQEAEEDKAASTQQQPKLLLALGLENGSILLWSPTGSSSTTLSHPTSTSAVTALSTPVGIDSETVGHLWSAHADGSVRVWDLATNSLSGKATGLPEGTHWDDLAVSYLPISSEGKKRHVHLLLSHLTLHLFDVSLGASKKDKVRELKTVEKGKCTGHVEAAFVRFTGKSASSTSSPSTDNATMSDSDDEDDTKSVTFLSYCPTDRFVQIWSLPLSSSRSDGLLVARLGLDSGVQSLNIATSPLDEDEEILAAIDAAGKVSLARLPTTFPPAISTPGKKGKTGVIALEVESEVTGKGGVAAGVAKVGFTTTKALKVCRGAVKPSFEVVSFTDDEGAWIAKVELEKSAGGLLNGAADEDRTAAGLPTRYAETASSSVRTGDALPEPASDDELDAFVNTGELDVDMAEPTLAERLKAMNVSKAAQISTGDDEGEELELEDEEEDDEDNVVSGPAVPATTLTTTLIQALHSSDSPLLESCLAHGQPGLIRATVKRLPSGSLVLNLLEALVERLGKGKKGSQSSASVKRAKNLIEWVRQVLVVHVGFLVTIPSLVTRLAALHASLTSRLALQPTLLALNGRLELVVSQIDLRQERFAARAAVTTSSKKSQGKKYVEGESSDEEESEAEMDGSDVESEEEGSVEDVVLGDGAELSEGDEDDDEEFDDDEDLDEDDFDEDDEEEENSDEEPKKRTGIASMLDLEASEEESEEDSEEDEESD